MSLNNEVLHHRKSIDEMEATIIRLREEIERLTEQRSVLVKGNLKLYHSLTQVDF